MRTKKEIRKMKMLLGIAFIILTIVDIWLIRSEGLNLSKHIPGTWSVVLGIWIYGIHRLEKLPPEK